MTGSAEPAKWVSRMVPGAAPAGHSDHDHGQPWEQRGTDRANLHPPTRHWHNAKTKAGWTITPNTRGGWTWTSPLGQTHHTEPHDYRLGP